MKWLKKYVWGILAAIGGLALTIFCLSGWWDRRKASNMLIETAEEVAKRNVKRAKELAKAREEKATIEAQKDVNDAQTEALNEVDKDDRSLGDVLAGLGAGRGRSLDETE